MKRRKTSKLVALFLAVALLGSCNQDNNTDDSDNTENDDNSEKTEFTGEATLTMWHTFTDVETEVFENNIISKFNDEFPNIKIDNTRMPSGEEYNQQIIQAVSSDSAPDLARMDIVDVPRYAEIGALEALDSYPDFDSIAEQMFTGPLNSNLYDGNYYGLPLDTNTKVAIWNKTLLDKAGVDSAPETWDDYLEISRKISDDDTFGIAPQQIGAWGLMPYFYSLGGTYCDESQTTSTGYLNSEESVEALEKLVSYHKEGLVAPSVLGGLGTWEGFKGNNYLMIDDGPWFISANEDIKDNVLFSTMPEGVGGSINTVGGENTVIFSSSKNKDAAYQFAKFLASDDAQTIFAEELQMMPVNKITSEKDIVQNDEMLKVYMEQLETSVPRIPSPQWNEIDAVLSKAFESALREEGNPKELLDAAAEQIDILLSEGS